MLAGYRTYLSILVSGLATLGGQLGIEIDSECLNNSVLSILGLVSAAYFHYKTRR